MKKLVSIKRDKELFLGLVEFTDNNGVRKFANFDKSWSDEKVCKVFGIEYADKTAKKAEK